MERERVKGEDESDIQEQSRGEWMGYERMCLRR